jgi:hypothetical protein
MAQISMFETAAQKLDAPEPWDRPDFMSMAGRKKLRLDDSWRWVQAEVIKGTPDFMLRMGQEVGEITRGKNKGRKKYTPEKERRQVVVNRELIDAEQNAWEAEHKVCSDCGGTKRELCGFGRDGDRFRACSRCKATGVPPQPKAAS